eukprot:364647-Chlamydomonas_euryale.AAC.8
MCFVQCTRRWFDETKAAAAKGSARHAALLSKMLERGFGCRRHALSAARWRAMAVAQRINVSLGGVYSESEVEGPPMQRATRAAGNPVARR